MREHLFFRESNPDKYYIIRYGKGGIIEFEGRIKPGERFHGKCFRYFVHSDKVRHLASETNYLDGKKHGLEIHYERNGEINWRKEWKMGEQISLTRD